MSKSTRKRKGEKIASLSPKEVETYLIMGWSNCKLGKLQEAINIFEKATKIDPNHVKVHFYLGHSYLRFSKFSAAISILRR
jgi:tetratricopeptide (TPR) repeat protein